MSIVDQIGEIIQKQGLTFKSVERACGLGNGTIKRWEYQSPRLDGLLKVSNYLHVALDTLVNGKDGVPAAEPWNTPLESELIRMFHYINDRDKETVFDFITALYLKTCGKKISAYEDLCKHTEEKEEAVML